MQLNRIYDRRAMRDAMADAAYCRLRALLEADPAVFTAVREGLAINAAIIEDQVLCLGSDDALSRALVMAGGTGDRWLLRATYRYWLLHPEAFGCTEELPAGVRDQRWNSIAMPADLTAPIADLDDCDEPRTSIGLATARRSCGSWQPVRDDSCDE